MSVRPHPTKPGCWQIDYRPNGRNGSRERIAFQGTKDEAFAVEQNLRITSRGSQEILAFPTIVETIPDFMDFYRMDHQPSGADYIVKT